RTPAARSCRFIQRGQKRGFWQHADEKGRNYHDRWPSWLSLVLQAPFAMLRVRAPLRSVTNVDRSDRAPPTTSPRHGGVCPDLPRRLPPRAQRADWIDRDVSGLARG